MVNAALFGVLVLGMVCDAHARSLGRRTKRSETVLNIPCQALLQLIHHTHILRSQTRSVTEYIQARNRWPPNYIRQLANIALFNMDNNGDDEDQMNDGVLNPAEVLLNDRKSLFEFALYLETSLTSGIIPNISGENTLKTRLQDLKHNVYTTMYTLDCILAKQRISFCVTIPRVSQVFIDGGNTATNEQMRTFVLVNSGTLLVSEFQARYHLLRASSC